MKKILAKLFCLMLITCVAVMSLIACSESSWKGNVTLKNSGVVWENAGCIAETENYLYFINGMESSTAKNEMGKPLKGALLVADKNDLTKTEVVVPKLFVASDYNAGVFIDGGYVYYATPSVEKNSQGSIANDELSFKRTKLDGSGKTDDFFTIDSDSALATEYRIVKGENGGVFIYYYNEDNLSIVCYNTSTKTSTEIIKQSDKANGDSLDKFVFLKSKVAGDVVGYYTTTVYLDTYNAESASKPNYSRQTALYNRVYVIKAGSTVGELVADGENTPDNIGDDIKYSISSVNGEYLFFTTSNTGRTDTFALTLEDAKVSGNWADLSVRTPIENASYISGSTFIVSLDEVYVESDTKIYKTTLTEKDDKTKTPVALKEDINKILFIEDGEMYFYNVEGHVAKFALDSEGEVNDDKKVILVSEDTAATSWYDVELKEINGKKYLFYCDNSLTGKSYIKYVDLSADVIEKDTDNDGENDMFYLDTEKIYLLGKMTNSDSAAVFDTKVETQATFSPADGIGSNAEDDQTFYDTIMELKAEYEALPSAVKEKVSQTAKNTLTYIEKAFEIAEEYKKLDGIEKVGSAQEAEEKGFKLIYDEMKKDMQAFKNSAERDAVDIFISNNLKSNWTKAVNLFEGED